MKPSNSLILSWARLRGGGVVPGGYVLSLNASSENPNRDILRYKITFKNQTKD